LGLIIFIINSGRVFIFIFLATAAWILFLFCQARFLLLCILIAIIVPKV